jgi:hypothetical protein
MAPAPVNSLPLAPFAGTRYDALRVESPSVASTTNRIVSAYNQYKIANSASKVKTPKKAAKTPTENAVVRRKAIVIPQRINGKMGAKNQR